MTTRLMAASPDSRFRVARPRPRRAAGPAPIARRSWWPSRARPAPVMISGTPTAVMAEGGCSVCETSGPAMIAPTAPGYASVGQGDASMVMASAGDSPGYASVGNTMVSSEPAPIGVVRTNYATPNGAGMPAAGAPGMASVGMPPAGQIPYARPDEIPAGMLGGAPPSSSDPLSHPGDARLRPHEGREPGRSPVLARHDLLRTQWSLGQRAARFDGLRQVITRKSGISISRGPDLVAKVGAAFVLPRRFFSSRNLRRVDEKVAKVHWTGEMLILGRMAVSSGCASKVIQGRGSGRKKEGATDRRMLGPGHSRREPTRHVKGVTMRSGNRRNL